MVLRCAKKHDPEYNHSKNIQEIVLCSYDWQILFLCSSSHNSHMLHTNQALRSLWDAPKLWLIRLRADVSKYLMKCGEARFLDRPLTGANLFNTKCLRFVNKGPFGNSSVPERGPGPQHGPRPKVPYGARAPWAYL